MTLKVGEHSKIVSPLFVKVDVTYCHELGKAFNKKQLSKIDPFDYSFLECGMIGQSVMVRKDLIRCYSDTYSVDINKVDRESEDPTAPLEITRFNVPHCRLETEKNNNLIIWASCEEFEKEFLK